MLHLSYGFEYCPNLVTNHTQLESTAQGNMEPLSGPKEQSKIKQLLLNDFCAAVWRVGGGKHGSKEIC